MRQLRNETVSTKTRTPSTASFHVHPSDYQRRDATRFADADATGVQDRRATAGKVGHDAAKLPAEFKCPRTAVAIVDTGWGAAGTVAGGKV